MYKVLFWLNHGLNAGVLHAFLAFQVSGEQFYADVAKDILLYVSRDLSDKVNHLQSMRFLPVEPSHALLCTLVQPMHP